MASETTPTQSRKRKANEHFGCIFKQFSVPHPNSSHKLDVEENCSPGSNESLVGHSERRLGGKTSSPSVRPATTPTRPRIALRGSGKKTTPRKNRKAAGFVQPGQVPDEPESPWTWVFHTSSPLSRETMAPTYSRAQNRRQNRTGLVDHDIYEGLPVRQWRRDYVTVAPPPSQETTTSQNDIWAIELPHGMPKDSHLLPQHSQDLLRAARSGKIYKRPAPVEEEEVDPEVVLGEKPEKKDDDLKDKGFMAKAWKQIPRHLEASDVDFLAKRRKGLITLPPKGSVPAPTLIKATVKRTDAVGNEYVQDVVVPQGQHVEGEVISQTVIPDPNLVAVPVQPTPPRRKVPSSRKKVKGSGRGRKKRANAPTSVPAVQGIVGAVPSVVAAEGALGADDIKTESDTASHQNEDTEMGGGSNAPSDNEEGDEGEDGDDSEDEEGSDGHGSPAKTTRPPSPVPTPLPTMSAIPEIEPIDTEMSGTEIPPLTKILTGQEKSDVRFGSPLKHVALATSTLNSPREASPAAGLPEPPKVSEEIPILEHTMQEEVAETAPLELPPVPPEPTIKEEIAAVETLREEEEEEEMLLDIIENVTAAPVVEAPAISDPTPEPEVLKTSPAPVEAIVTESELSEPPESRSDEATQPEPVTQEESVPLEEATTSDEAVTQEEVPTQQEIVTQEEPIIAEETIDKVVEEEIAKEEDPVKEEEIIKEEDTAKEQEPVKEEAAAPIQEDEDDDFPDLLGGLEKSLETSKDS